MPEYKSDEIKITTQKALELVDEMMHNVKIQAEFIEQVSMVNKIFDKLADIFDELGADERKEKIPKIQHMVYRGYLIHNLTKIVSHLEKAGNPQECLLLWESMIYLVKKRKQEMESNA